MITELRKAVIAAYHESKLTQSQLAKLANMHQSYVNTLLRQRKIGGYGAWLKLASALRLEPETILMLTAAPFERK